MSVIHVQREEAGYLVTGDDAPIGFIDTGGVIHTPSGAEYRVEDAGPETVLRSATGPAVTLGGNELRDTASGVAWRLRDAWRDAVKGGTLELEEIWALPYTMEDAQGTVPNRVRLLLAGLISRDAGV